MDYRKKFAVEAGKRPGLSKIDPSYAGKHESHDKALPEIQSHVERLEKLQYLLYAGSSKSLLVVLQALDAAGKDGVIRHLHQRYESARNVCVRIQAAEQIRGRP